MVDRGTDLSCISQYPHDEEICFAHLTGLEVVSTSVEGSVLVVQVRLNTIEQVISRKRKAIYDMGTAPYLEVRDELVKRADGHCDPQGNPSWCRFSGLSPNRGERYRHHERHSICARAAQAGSRRWTPRFGPRARSPPRLVVSLLEACCMPFPRPNRQSGAVESVPELKKVVTAASSDSLRGWTEPPP